jgi:hypothetical protein
MMLLRAEGFIPTDRTASSYTTPLVIYTVFPPLFATLQFDAQPYLVWVYSRARDTRG